MSLSDLKNSLSLVRRQGWKLALGLVALLPGILGIARLHPYEYMYYNALAGPTASVYQSFESDYWCTSYRVAIEWLDEHAEDNPTVEVGSKGGRAMVAPYARPDMRLISLKEEGNVEPDWAVLCDGKGGMANLLPDAATVFTVERDGVILSQVKKVEPSP